MVMEFHDFVGFSGAFSILLAYFLLQIKKMSAESLIYSLLNLIGSFLILFSLAYAWNLTSVLIEIVWVGISLFGVFKWYKAHYAERASFHRGGDE